MATCQSETVNSSLQAPATAPMPKLGRRTVLAGLAVTSIAGTAAAAEPDEVEAVVNAWREWRELQVEDIALTPKMNATYDAQPKLVQIPGLEFLGQWHISEDTIDPISLKAPAWMASAIPAMTEAAKRELRALQQHSAVELECCGYLAMEARSDEIIEMQRELIDRIEGSNSIHPAVIAAKIDLSLSEGCSTDFLGDCPWVPLTTILRSLLPHLPSDMAAVLAPAAERRARRIGELFGLPAEV